MSPSLDELVKHGPGDQDLLINTGTEFEAAQIKDRSGWNKKSTTPPQGG